MKEKTWVEINIDNLKHNYSLIKRKAKGSLICPVIKDNAYGHGAVRLAKLYEELNCDYLAVSNIDEAIELRNANIKTPILILGYTPIEFAKELSIFDITQCIYSLEYAHLLNQCGYLIKSHLKVDTGMNRIGFKDVNEMIEAYNLENLNFEGIFTHFAKTSDKEFSNEQFNLFTKIINELKENNCNFKIRHCCNSGALFEYDDFHLDMVRPGIVLYGLGGYEGLIQALQLKTIITEIKTINVNETVGYERNYVAKENMKIATIAIGYGDGFFRCNSGKNTVCVNGCDCNIVGNICMDQMMIDVNNIDCKVGDEVLLYKDIELSAKNINTISYELICGIDSRVKILYK